MIHGPDRAEKIHHIDGFVGPGKSLNKMEGYSWENRTKWRIFQQATFDCRRANMWFSFVSLVKQIWGNISVIEQIYTYFTFCKLWRAISGDMMKHIW